MSAPRSSWLARRLGSVGLRRELEQWHVPSRSAAHYLGAVVLWLLLLQVATGVLLMLFYHPSPDAAHGSIVDITAMPHGGVFRSLHAWASHLFVGALGAEALAVLYWRYFTPPREVVWWSAVLLLPVGVGLAFTGSILPWSPSAQMQAHVSSELVAQTPFVGAYLVALLRGGHEVTDWTLHHAFGFHAGVLPAVAALLAVAHLGLLLRLTGRRSPEGARATIPLYPDFAVRAAAACVGVLVALMTLALLAPVPLDRAADLARPVADGVLPPWYLLFLHELLRAAPAKLLGLDSAEFVIGGLVLFGALAALLPVVDRRGSRASVGIGLASFVTWLLLTIHAAS